MPPNDATLAHGIRICLEALLEAEADYLCGARRYQRSETRRNSRAGLYQRNLRTSMGNVSVKVPTLKYLYPRVSMRKRYRRIESIVIESLVAMHQNGVSDTQVRLVITSIWTIDLPAPRLDELTALLTPILESWRVPSAFSG